VVEGSLVTFSLERKSNQKVQGKDHCSPGFFLPARGVSYFTISAFGYSRCWSAWVFTSNRGKIRILRNCLFTALAKKLSIRQIFIPSGRFLSRPEQTMLQGREGSLLLPL